jgi:putative DNA primase/helicase
VVNDRSQHNGEARGRALLDFHLEQLRASAISDEVIRGRGYSSVGRPTAGDGSSRDKLRRLGIPAWARNEDARYPGLLIPLFRATGELIGVQYRPDSAPREPRTGKLRKYAAQAGRSSVADVHPLNHGRIIDPSVPLWLTEGVKKADALTTQGLCAVALSGVWNWRSTLGTLGDWEDIPLKGRDVAICYDADIRGNKSVGRAMERLGRWLKSKGAGRVLYVIPPGVNGIIHKGVDDFFAAGGTLELLWTGASDTPPVAAENLLVDPEGYMVEQLAEETLDGRYLWAPGLGWLAYRHHEGRWQPVDDVAVTEETRRWLVGKHAQALAALQDAMRQGYGPAEIRELEKVASAWRKENSRSRITNLTALARGLMMRDAGDFDAHADLLNCPNGVVRLEDGTRDRHDPDLLFTRVTRTAYVPGATHPDWDKALEAIPAGVRGYMQLRYGQGITGHVPPDDVVLIEIGTGENGKTTIKAGVQAALGTAGNRGSGYIAYLSARVLMADESAHPTEIMDLRGARLGVLEETPEDHRLRTTRLKLVTSDTITARLIRENTVTFANACSVIVSTNYRPVVAETDHGTWRRLLALVYPFRFRKPHEDLEGEHDRHGDPGLRERVKAGDGGVAEAVLAWLVSGAVRWYGGEPAKAAADGTVEARKREPMSMGEPPAQVVNDTAEWREGCDLVMGYAADHLMFDDPKRHIAASELTADVNQWLTGTGHREWSDRTVETRFGGHEVFTSHRVSKSRKYSYEAGISRRTGWVTAALPTRFRAWLGVRFRTDEDDLAEMARNGDSAAQSGSGTGGTGRLVNAIAKPLTYAYQSDPSHLSQAWWQSLYDSADFGDPGQ